MSDPDDSTLKHIQIGMAEKLGLKPLEGEQIYRFLEKDAEFSPIHARHYVFTKEEADKFAKLIGIEATARFQLDMHLALARFTTSMIAPAMPLSSATRVVCKTISDGQLLDLDDLRKDPACNAVIVGIQSMLKPNLEASRVPASMKAIADSVLPDLPRGAKGGKHPNTEFCCFVGQLCDAAIDAGAELGAIPSNEALAAKEPTEGVIGFIRAAIDRSTAVAFKIANHMPHTEAEPLRERARTYSDLRARSIADRFRDARNCDRGANCRL